MNDYCPAFFNKFQALLDDMAAKLLLREVYKVPFELGKQQGSNGVVLELYDILDHVISAPQKQKHYGETDKR